jgi:uncharacterized membrane protein HdeD (DUF308 family)
MSSVTHSTDTRPTAGAWWILALEAVALIALGALAAIAPFLAAIAATVAVGWILIIAGVLQIASGLAHRSDGWVWALAGGALSLIAGLAMCAQPLVGLFSLTLVLGAYFTAHAILSFVRAAGVGRRAGRAAWLVVGGLADLVLAAVVVAGLWVGALWLVGLLVAVNLVFAGAALLTLAIAWRGRPAKA